ncbi:hypothetical protein EZ428_08265 [Pedobacter frigiditerrae]|uniref:Uncharacterized protein n=2 Tax=Pedobacter frigiditerrae TaxID=2530452 RepID=A0A4R0MX02_9SPHI|nr:hypothetical protein EZ428_08265 [Pedobacter frigiditerrae]
MVCPLPIACKVLPVLFGQLALYAKYGPKSNKALNMITSTTKKLSFFILLLAFVQLAQAQVKVGDNPTEINKGSLLELESSNKGLLFPRVNLTNTTTWSLAAASTPVAGMILTNLTSGQMPLKNWIN